MISNSPGISVIVRYFAILGEGISLGNPSGLVRRREIDGFEEGEIFTRDLRWERSFIFIDRWFGKGADLPFEEVDRDEAESITTMLTGWWLENDRN